LPCRRHVVIAMCGIIRNSRLQCLERGGRRSRAIVMEDMAERGAKMFVVE
jgi:hypothetical protein